MTTYLVHRMLQMLVVIVGVILLLFVALYLVPSDPAQTLVGQRPVPTEFREALAERYGLDEPLPTQIRRYLSNVVRLDFGESVISGRPIRDVIFERAPVSARLAGAGAVFLVVLGIGSGIVSAARRNSIVDGSVTLAAIVLVSIPVFVLGVLLQVFVALKTKSVLGLPVTGLDAGLKSYLLPGFTLAAASIAYVSRVQRATMVETLQADYVRTARSKGLRERRVLMHHAWRNSLIPVVTSLGIDIGAFLGGAILTETVFNINGLGRTLALAVTQGDNQVVIAIGTFTVFVYLAINLVIDLSYAVLDPRIRLGGRAAA